MNSDTPRQSNFFLDRFLKFVLIWCYVTCKLPPSLKLQMMIDSRVRFLGAAGQMHLFPVGPNPSWPPATILKISDDDFSATGSQLRA